jgi:hypothetical protein
VLDKRMHIKAGNHGVFLGLPAEGQDAVADGAVQSGKAYVPGFAPLSRQKPRPNAGLPSPGVS